MPKYLASVDKKEVVWRYDWPAKYVTPVEGIGDALREWRRQATKDREELLVYQKASGREDPATARFFKEQANWNMRLIRAIGFHIPWFSELDAKQVEVRPNLWPVDLSPELDHVANRIMLEFG